MFIFLIAGKKANRKFCDEETRGCGSLSAWGYVSEFQRFVPRDAESSAAGPSNRKSYHNKMAVLPGTFWAHFWPTALLNYCVAPAKWAPAEIYGRILYAPRNCVEDSVAHVAFVTNSNIIAEYRDLWLKFLNQRDVCSRQILFIWQILHLFKSSF